MFSVGDGAPRSGRRVIVSDPGHPLMTGSVHPVPAPRLLLLTMWCSVVYCGAVWCTVVHCGVVWCTVVLYGGGTNVIVSEIASFYAPVCAAESAGFLQELIVKFFEDYRLQN